MDHAVYSVATLKKEFDDALKVSPNHEAAVHAAAQKLGITVEAVQQVVGPATQEA